MEQKRFSSPWQLGYQTFRGPSAGVVPTLLQFITGRDFSRWFLSGAALKWIAIACMVVDHVAAVLVYAQYRKALGNPAVNASDIYQVYYWMRVVGRVTLPVFCFELVEGVTHTRSMPKYALRLLLFALVSEIPYDLALHCDDASWTVHLNVICTLFLAFLPLWFAESVGRRLALPWWVTKVVAAFAIYAMAQACDTYVHPSYAGYGIALVGVLYLAKESRLAQLGLASLLTVLHDNELQMWCIVGLAFVCLLYSGKKGRGSKWFFYAFYPGHLLILALIAGNATLPAFTRLFL